VGEIDGELCLSAGGCAGNDQNRAAGIFRHA
jgi:hypothetical protein